MKKILKVVSQGVVTYIPSQKSEGGQLAKCVIRLKELGGAYEDEYACSAFGNLALCKFYEGDCVVASLRFRVNEANGNLWQDCVVTDMVKINK